MSNSHEVVKTAMAIAPHVFVRPGELVAMKWAEVDFEKREWRYLATKTKTNHIVPLSDFVLEKLKALHEISGRRQYAFTRVSSGRHITTNAMLVSLKRMGFDSTIHGFRATARTLLAEKLKFPESVIELQLAHEVRDALGRSYNRTTFIEDRHRMMAVWSNYLIELTIPNF
jgi:integrase